MPLSRDQILKAPDIQTEAVPCPEWGGDVLVQGMTGAQRDIYTSMLVDQDGKPRANIRNAAAAKLIMLCAVDEDGTPLFSEADVAALNAKSAATLERVAEVALRLSGMKKPVEDQAKNLPAALSGDSGLTLL